MLDITTGFAHTVQSWAFLGPGELSVWRASADGKPRRPSHYEVHHARRGGWAKCTPVCKQQIDGLICHLVWRKTSFIFWGGGGIHFSNPNEPINLCPSPGAFPASERGEEGAEEEKRSASLFSLIFLSPTSYLLSPLISFPLTLIHALPSKASFCLFAFSEFVSSFLPSFLQHHPRRVPVMHL